MRIVGQEVVPPAGRGGQFVLLTTFETGTTVALSVEDHLVHRAAICGEEGHDWMILSEYGEPYPMAVYCACCGEDSGLVNPDELGEEWFV